MTGNSENASQQFTSITIKRCSHHNDHKTKYNNLSFGNLISSPLPKKDMDYKRIHESIMKSDPKIRLVTICDLNGKIIQSDHREGVKNLLTPSHELAVNSWKTRSQLAQKIGKGKYVLAEYEKINGSPGPWETRTFFM